MAGSKKAARTAPKAEGDARTLTQAIAEAKEGATVVLDPGRYELEEPLRIERAITLRGEGVTIVAAKKASAVVVATSAKVTIEGLTIEGSKVTAIEARGADLTLRGCSLAGPGYRKDREGMHGVHARGGALSVTKCTFRGFDGGASVDEGATGEIADSTAEKNDTGIFVTGGARATVVRVTASDNRMGIFFHEAGRGEIRDCVAETNEEVSLGGQGDTVDLTVITCRAGSKKFGMHFAGKGRARAVRNVVAGKIHAGLEIEVEIVGNVVRGSEDVGIFLTGSARGVVRHNLVTSGKNNGIGVWGKASPTVRNNVSVNNAFAGLVVAGSATPAVAFNFARQNRENGVWVHAESRATVTHNDLTENVTNGILAYEKTTSTLRWNHCEQNDSDGILVSGSAAPVVEDNTLVGNTINGFEATQKTKPVVRRNRSLHNTCDGFRLDGETRAVVEENVAMGNQEDGISILDKATAHLRGNRCEGNDDAGIRVIGKRAKPTFDGDVLAGNGEEGIVREKGKG